MPKMGLIHGRRAEPVLCSHVCDDTGVLAGFDSVLFWLVNVH